jgi:methylmalonyl-CoA/ethylmalonyl-CoA epimerase
MQVGIVVRDLDAALRRYVDDYGIGPWDIYEFNPGNAKDLREYGQPVERSRRLETAMVGRVQWELIQPLDESIYAQFLAEKGGSVHHIAVAAPKFDEMLATQAKRGNDLVFSGEFSGIRVRVRRHGARSWCDYRGLQPYARTRHSRDACMASGPRPDRGICERALARADDTCTWDDRSGNALVCCHGRPTVVGSAASKLIAERRDGRGCRDGRRVAPGLRANRKLAVHARNPVQCTDGRPLGRKL